MKLEYSVETKEVLEIISRLKRLSLAHKIVLNDKNVEPALIDGKQEYRGIDKMNVYIDQLDSEKEQWYYCNC